MTNDDDVQGLRYIFPSSANTIGRPEYDTKKHGPATARLDGSVVPGPQLQPAVPARARHG